MTKKEGIESKDIHFRLDDEMDKLLTRMAKLEGLTRNMFAKRVFSIEMHKLKKQMEDTQ